MDKEIELMKAIESQIFQVHCTQVLDRLLLLPFDHNWLKLLLNNLNEKKNFLLKNIQNIGSSLFSMTINNQSIPKKLTFPYQSKWLRYPVIKFRQDNPIVEKHSSYLFWKIWHNLKYKQNLPITPDPTIELIKL
jgi:hypothetical protein